jgi:drug/metabolite transporter (DMT)-like permease
MVLALQQVPLRIAAAWGALSIVLTMAASSLVLGERLTTRMKLGSATIVLGVVLLSLAS